MTKFQTTINCGNCVAKVTPYLNETLGEGNWQVDTQSPEKMLTVSSASAESDVIAAVNKAGYKAELIAVSTANAFGNAASVQVKVDAFWADKDKWKRASFNTLNCLIGCSLGDFGAVIYMQANHIHLPMWQMMSIAMICGLATSVLLEAAILKFRESFAWKSAFETALKMSFISMLVMELAENFTDLALTGNAMPMDNPFYWVAIAVSMMVGFIVPLPYNYYKLKKYNQSCH